MFFQFTQITIPAPAAGAAHNTTQGVQCIDPPKKLVHHELCNVVTSHFDH